MLIDTHCHLTFKEYDSDREAALERARAAGVTDLVEVGIDLETSRRCADFAQTHPGVWAAAGWHPHGAGDVKSRDVEALASLVNEYPRIRAIGEIGLDYFKSEAPRGHQASLFEAMLELACRHHLPAIIHSRDAFEDTLRILIACRRVHPGFRAVFHCFTYGPEEMRKVADAGFWVSFTGVVTFPSAGRVREALALVPEDRWMLETDCPYLAPPPHRGKRNEPSYVADLLAEVARLRGEDSQETARVTSQNARRFFGLPTPAAEGAA
ncbi:MAG: TatD family hydrolase [Candidatus Omnitrophica bacterium]|nr:TatD family hydrolase [Candidatus Omnitrophota bacterium]